MSFDCDLCGKPTPTPMKVVQGTSAVCPPCSKPKKLRKMWYKGKAYFIDPKLQEIRNVQNPHDTLSFEDYCEARKEVTAGCGWCQLHGVCEL